MTNICSPRLRAHAARPSTPPTGSWSSSRPGTARCRPRTRRGRSTRSGTSPPGSRARCSPTSSTATRGSPGAARASGWRSHPAPRSRWRTPPTSSSTSRRPASRPARRAICEIGAVRVRGLELEERFETLVNPRRPLPAPIAALTGIDPRALRGAPPVELAVRRFLEFAGDAVLVAHNARFDMGFLDREVERLTGRRVAAPVVDTVWLARRLLEGRTKRVGLASLALLLRHRGPAVPPRAARRGGDGRDPARADRPRAGARRRDGGAARRPLRAACAAARREALARRRRAAAAGRLPLPRPERPGALRRPRPRPARAAALVLPHRAPAARRSRRRSARSSGSSGACSAPSSRRRSRSCGSCASCGRPANARSARPDRYVYLRRRGTGWCVTDDAGPVRAAQEPPPRAAAAARALGGWEGEPADALPRAAGAAAAPLGRPPLRGRGAAARPDRGARGRRRVARGARPAARARALPARAGGRGGLPAGVLRLAAAASPRRARCCPAPPAATRPEAGSRRRPGQSRRSARPTPTSCS